MVGTFRPEGAADDFAGFWAFVTNSDTSAQDPPFADELWDSANWRVVDEKDDPRGIEVPAVHSDGTIMWRWS
jgi:hypothetical protein